MMHLKIKPIVNHLKDYYSEKSTITSTDSGLDLILPTNVVIPKNTLSFKIPLGISCEPFFVDSKPRGYTLYARSSTGSKTPLRLSNGTGIIDYGYRGEITACVDNISNDDFTAIKGQRLFQLCSPDLSPISFEVTNCLSDSARQQGGYGSTGV